MKLSDLDTKLVNAYLPQIVEPIKHAENAVFFWFPGAGMTTIVRDLFTSKKLLANNLGKLAQQLEIIEAWGHLADKKTLPGLLHHLGFDGPAAMHAACQRLIDDGYEVVYVVGRTDDYPEREKLAILKLFIRLNAINPRRVHILFNSVNKPWFLDALAKHPELLVLAQRMEILPVISGELLAQYIDHRAKEFDYALSSIEQQKVLQTYGGVLQLTKEFLRSKGNTSLISLKLKIIWNNIPKEYQELFQKLITDDAPKLAGDNWSDLQKFGVTDLKMFEANQKVLNIDSAKVLNNLLTEEEKQLWQYISQHTNELIARDTVTTILRPENADDISFWAVDKAVSRFRSKLARSGIDPEVFKTVKGKGYRYGQ